MYFTYLDLPPVPQHLEEQILQIVDKPLANFHDSSEFVEYLEKNRNELNISAGQEVINAITNVDIDYSKSLGFPLNEVWKYFKDLAHFDFLEVNDEINNWARSAISPDIAHVSIQAMYGGTTITPHIDEMRVKALNYVISTGGNSKTCFYKPKTEFEHLIAYPQTVFPFDRLELLEEVHIQPHKWHELNVTKIHSVENLDPLLKRISLSLSFL
jgi:hypothetical protein